MLNKITLLKDNYGFNPVNEIIKLQNYTNNQTDNNTNNINNTNNKIISKLIIYLFLKKLYKLMNENGNCFLKGAFIIELKELNELNELETNLLNGVDHEITNNLLKSHTSFINPNKLDKTNLYEIHFTEDKHFNPFYGKCLSDKSKDISKSIKIALRNLKFYFFKINNK